VKTSNIKDSAKDRAKMQYMRNVFLVIVIAFLAPADLIVRSPSCLPMSRVESRFLPCTFARWLWLRMYSSMILPGRPPALPELNWQTLSMKPHCSLFVKETVWSHKMILILPVIESCLALNVREWCCQKKTEGLWPSQ